MRILLVDDEREYVSTLAERLSLRGIEADWVSDPAEAVLRAGEQVYDLAVLDVKMPRIDGIALKRLLEAKQPRLKFLFITGHGEEGAFKAGVSEAGPDHYLFKPVMLDDFLRKIDEVMSEDREEGRDE